MIKKMKQAGVIQTKITVGNYQENIACVREHLAGLAVEENSLLVLPELWATGFAYRQLEKEGSDWYWDALTDLAEICSEKKIIICGTLPHLQQESPIIFANRLHVIGATGELGVVDKQMLFPGEERLFVASETQPCVVETPLGVLGCFVCYDLRFPYIARHLAQQGADILVCCAQWPAARIHQWRTLLIARAIENQIFVVGCNGIGRNNIVKLGGHSLIVSPTGEILAEASSDSSCGLVVDIDLENVGQTRGCFNTVAAQPQKKKNLDKIMVPDDCVALVQRKAKLGQKIIFARIANGDLGLEEMERLADARARGDVLVVGVDCARAAIIGSFGKLGIILKRYAALENIDIVFDLNLLEQNDAKMLAEYCEPVLIE